MVHYLIEKRAEWRRAGVTANYPLPTKSHEEMQREIAEAGKQAEAAARRKAVSSLFKHARREKQRQSETK